MLTLFFPYTFTILRQNHILNCYLDIKHCKYRIFLVLYIQNTQFREVAFVKLSETSNMKSIYTILKEAGIHSKPETLTNTEIKELTKDPKIRGLVYEAFCSNSLNFYQELEMDSPYVNTHRDISYAPENVQLHSHSFYEILYCESGSIQYLIADKRYRIHAGDIILIPPGISHRPIFYEDMPEPYSRIVLWISADFLRSMASFCSDDLLHQLRAKEHFLLRTEGSSYKYLEKLFIRGALEASEASPMWDIALYGNTATLLAHLGRAMLSSQIVFPMEKREDLDKIISYIENNYAEKISLEATAKKFHISTSTLGKMFYNKLGISFYQFVTQRRLINSKLQIEEGTSMEDVALSCGFCDYSAFYRAFKKEYGISPREYKKLVANTLE